MELKEFIEIFIKPNSIIRLVHEVPGGHSPVVPSWDDVSREWEILKGKGKHKSYLHNEVIHLATISTSNFPDAINICISLNKKDLILERLEDTLLQIKTEIGL